ncbi:MAG: M6 family metalloprotease domain-containing protein [Muribaculaceae bacterium]|nr:M6 family metalloprotease domain-containing protein [Muribaculaceae bacterium]
MRKFLSLFVLGLMCLTLQAVPADPTPGQITQPDGTKLTVILHGDEFFNYLTTEDGYTIVKNEAGYYTYARLDGSNLVASKCIARNERTAADRAYLAGVPKGLTSPAMVQNGKKLKNHRNNLIRGIGHGGHMDYSKFRGLIVLINYTDITFEDCTPSNYTPYGFYDEMINGHDYKGFTLPAGTKVDCMGSVRDYYYDNSFKQFDPHFDILGPIDVPFASTDAHQFRCDSIFFAALEAVDADVDFSQYDTDEDGTVDMVFFLVAGYGSDHSDNNRDYLWPHMKDFVQSPVLDGVNFSLYACSTSMMGAQGDFISLGSIAGIGTICHEFSHCLGLPDFYDTDGTGSGGTNHAYPLTWSIMASGFKNNTGRNPVGYSLFERYALGFAQPVLIEGEGTVTVPVLESSNTGYRLNTANKKEYFIIENRQRVKWDKNLTGPGMLIWRVDSTNVAVWENNLVNSDPNHNYYELLRANFNGMSDSPRDPFPGTSNVTSISNATQPNLRTWDGKLSQYAFTNIAEADSIITFDVVRDNSKSSIETFEKMPVGATLNERGVAGVYATWDFYNCAVVDTAHVGNGHVVAMKNGSYFNTAENLNKIPKVVRFKIYNPTSTGVYITPQYSNNNGGRWRSLDTYPYDFYLAAGTEASATITSLPTNTPIMLRLKCQGSSTEYCYIDDIEICYENTWTPEPEEPDFIPGDVDGNGKVEITDVTMLINYIMSEGAIEINVDAADLSDDDDISITDLTMLINMIMSATE